MKQLLEEISKMGYLAKLNLLFEEGEDKIVFKFIAQRYKPEGKQTDNMLTKKIIVVDTIPLEEQFTRVLKELKEFMIIKLAENKDNGTAEVQQS